MKGSRFGPIGFVVLLLAALLNVAVLYTAERSFVELREAAGSARRTELAQSLIERLYRLVVDAETGQLRYLLTGDQTYLAPYHDAQLQSTQQQAELQQLTQDDPVQQAQLATVTSLLNARFAQIDETLVLKREADDNAVREFMASKKGAMTMASLRLALNGMAAEESRAQERRSKAFTASQDRVRAGFFGVAGLNLVLLMLGGIFLYQDSRRRNRAATEADERNIALSQAVRESTAELTELSHYLQRLQEDEKAKIAREIHDELGGTLAAAKIDLQLLSDKLESDTPHQVRIGRIMLAIDDAVQVKRRIIEELRPSMLDSLGIGAALRWQCSQFSKRSGVPCQVRLQNDNLRLSPAYSIAFYRVAQEALTNIGKHANAKNVAVSLQRDGEHWVMQITDNGIGIDKGRCHNPTAHGLLLMRERMRALGGEFSIEGDPGSGTVVQVRAPVEKEREA